MPSQVAGLLELLQSQTRGAQAEMRLLLYELRPDYLARTELSIQVEQLLTALKARKHLEVHYEKVDESKLPPEVHVAFFRIAQEAIHNIVKHAAATQVSVSLELRSYHAVLIIRDNGLGFDPSQHPTGLGMSTMRERAAAVQADFKIASQQGQGTEVCLKWEPQRQTV